MKKLSIAVAVALTSTSMLANAGLYSVSSNIVEDMVAPGVSDLTIGSEIFGAMSLELGGTVDATVSGSAYTINSSSLTLNGNQYLNASGTGVQITWAATGEATANGVLWNGGTLTISSSDGMGGWTPISVNDLSTTAISFEAAGPGLGGHLGQGQAGLQLGSGTVNGSNIDVVLPGLAPGGFIDPVFSQAVGSPQIMGSPGGMYWEGTVTMTPSAVPVPAAAWLFGSALLGLAGVGRKRSIAK